MQQRLTKRVVDDATPSDKDSFVWDTGLKGFGLKVTPAGRKSFIYQYRTGGRGTPTKRVTIGTYGALTTDQARTQAQRLAGAVADDRDPSAEGRQRKADLAHQSRNTFSGLIDAFIEQYAKRHQRQWQETERLLRHDAQPVWGKKPAALITRQDVDALLQSVASRAPISANRLGAALRKLFKWAVGNGRLEASPMAGMSLPSPERSRDRVLSDDELARLISAAESLGYPFGPFFMLLLLTAQRRDEVAGMRWSEIEENQWIIPAARSKNGRAHIVHLNEPALDILTRIPRQGDSNLIFTTTGTTPISGLSKAKDRLDELSAVRGWRFHDVRRTVTTGLANLGHPPHVCDKILNHTTGAISGVAAVYQKAEFLSERQTALDDWGRRIASLMPSA